MARKVYETMHSPLSDLTTDRLVLTPKRARHLATLDHLKNDWEVVRMLAMPAWPFVQRSEQVEQDEGFHHLTMLCGKEIVGEVTVKRAGSGTPPRAMPRLGYFVGRAFWGRGYATEALAATVAAIFDRPGFGGDAPAERVGAGVFVDNPASRRVLEKLGFTKAGSYSLYCRARDSDVDVDDMQVNRSEFAAVGGRTP
ncbi:RimJ/RimL family protein N-acetyltransferase [Rhodopseudomonas julia]|uniref:RimJ/RimL family protein N-acetyltransferase n=1 Tax=Rhodopseudomonas julia TaxID=200617 RepID=A0ABU0C7D0_9BRAD|nr:GNAT family protein [Rhodopseudomonas julia]MDQ0326430.1 RimJ/RimL family protein N-acetyltransferase [Rhodopseudomonas julia]